MPKLVTQNEWNERYNQVYGYFFRRLNNRADVDELTSDTVTEFFLKEIPIQNPKAFLFAIARNKLYQYIDKKSHNQNTSFDDLTETISYDTVDNYSNYYLSKTEELKKCIERQLKQQDKDIVELCIICEFSSQRVAEELKLKAPNIRQKLSRILKKLRNECRKIWFQYA